MMLAVGCVIADDEGPPPEPPPEAATDDGDESDDGGSDADDDADGGADADGGSTGGDSADDGPADDDSGDGPQPPPDPDTGDETGGEPQEGGNVGLCDAGGPAQDGLLALTDLTGTYEGFEGCLYPGSNRHPVPHPTVEPVDGLVGFGSIGMSNAAQEFTYFMDNVATPPPEVVMFNGAQGGQTSTAWGEPNNQVWDNFAQRIGQVGLSPDQLQVMWVKSALSHNSHAQLEDAALAEKEALTHVLQNLADKYPSVKIVYLTSRAYGGYGCGLSPEPAAYAHGYAIKWLIEEQIDGQHPDLPFLAWGPYIWADGATPRSDGHLWLPEDFGDGCHPNQQGRAKVADLMQQFFLEEAPWYAG